LLRAGNAQGSGFQRAGQRDTTAGQTFGLHRETGAGQAESRTDTAMLETRQNFHEELAALDQQILHMGRLTGGMVADAVASIQEGDVLLAEMVIGQDDVVDAIDIDIEARCMRLLALQQPMARDLRQIGTALKVITDLERIGDHAVDIAKISRKLGTQFFLRKPLVDLGPLAAMAQTMLSQSMEALIRHDDALASQICADDDQVDAAYKHLREELFAIAQHEPERTAPSSYMLLAITYLERIADHTTNIAERVHYVETGQREPLARDLRRGAMDGSSSTAL